MLASYTVNRLNKLSRISITLTMHILDEIILLYLIQFNMYLCTKSMNNLLLNRNNIIIINIHIEPHPIKIIIQLIFLDQYSKYTDW
jgi:hypothetical protein